METQAQEMQTIENNDAIRIAKLTDINHHTQARKELALLLNRKDLAECYAAIENLHSFFGHLPFGLRAVRDEIDVCLFSTVDKKCSNAENVKSLF